MTRHIPMFPVAITVTIFGFMILIAAVITVGALLVPGGR